MENFATIVNGWKIWISSEKSFCYLHFINSRRFLICFIWKIVTQQVNYGGNKFLTKWIIDKQIFIINPNFHGSVNVIEHFMSSILCAWSWRVLECWQLLNFTVSRITRDDAFCWLSYSPNSCFYTRYLVSAKRNFKWLFLLFLTSCTNNFLHISTCQCPATIGRQWAEVLGKLSY